MVAARGDRDHDPGPRVGSHLPAHVLAARLRAALRQVDKKLAAPPEPRMQEPWHGQHHLTMRDGIEHRVESPATVAALVGERLRSPPTPSPATGECRH